MGEGCTVLIARIDLLPIALVWGSLAAIAIVVSAYFGRGDELIDAPIAGQFSRTGHQV